MQRLTHPCLVLAMEAVRGLGCGTRSSKQLPQQKRKIHPFPLEEGEWLRKSGRLRGEFITNRAWLTLRAHFSRNDSRRLTWPYVHLRRRHLDVLNVSRNRLSNVGENANGALGAIIACAYDAAASATYAAYACASSCGAS
jgi:hypothetical protein